MQLRHRLRRLVAPVIGSAERGPNRRLTPADVAIIVLNFFFAQLLKEWYLAIYGVKGIFG